MGLSNREGPSDLSWAYLYGSLACRVDQPEPEIPAAAYFSLGPWMTPDASVFSPKTHISEVLA